MWQPWVGKILIFSNVLVLGLGQLFAWNLGIWNAIYPLLTALGAWIVGNIGAKKA